MPPTPAPHLHALHGAEAKAWHGRVRVNGGRVHAEHLFFISERNAQNVWGGRLGVTRMTLALADVWLKRGTREAKA